MNLREELELWQFRHRVSNKHLTYILLGTLIAAVVVALPLAIAKAAWQLEWVVPGPTYQGGATYQEACKLPTDCTAHHGTCERSNECNALMKNDVKNSTILKDCHATDERLATVEGSGTCEKVELLLAQVTTTPVGDPVPAKEAEGMYSLTTSERIDTKRLCAAFPDAESIWTPGATDGTAGTVVSRQGITPSDKPACEDFKPPVP